MPSRLLITRPEPAATRLAEEMRTAFPRAEVVVSPLIRIAYHGSLPEPASGETLIFTSRHGVEGFCRLSVKRDLPACVVGEATAEAARERGFEVRLVAADAGELLERLATEGVEGPFLHARGAHVAAEIADALRQAGHTAHEAVVYDQQALPLTDAARALLDGDAPVILPLMSPRSATLFFEAAGTPRAPLLVAAISRNVANRVPDGAATCVSVSRTPDIRALRSVLNDLEKHAKRVESQKGSQ